MVEVSFALWLPRFWKCALAWGLFWRKFRAPGKGAEGQRQQEQEQRTSQQEKSPGKGTRKGNRKGNRRTEKCKNHRFIKLGASWSTFHCKGISGSRKNTPRKQSWGEKSLLPQRVCCPWRCAMPVQHAKAPEQARGDTSPRKIDVTSKSPVGDISVVTLIRTDTTLDHSQKAEKVW